MKNITSHLLAIALIIAAVFLVQQGYVIPPFNMEIYGKIFVLLSLVSYISIAFQFYKKEIVDRIVLGSSLFVSVGALAFVFDNAFLRYYYETYQLALAFVGFIFVGIVTTFFTPAGFVGVLSSDRKAVLYASCRLLCLTVVMGVFALYTKSLSLGLILVIWYKERLQKQLRGEKVWVWSFKW